MKKWFLLVLGALGFALVWAAGHDILKGEPEARLEYAVVIAGLVLALACLGWIFMRDRTGGRG